MSFQDIFKFAFGAMLVTAGIAIIICGGIVFIHHELKSCFNI